MTNLYRIRADWTGFAGAPGVTTMYASTPTVAVPALRAFFEAVKSALPAVVSVQVQHQGDIIEDTTGELVGTWSEAAVAIVNGTGAGNYAAPAGAVVTWLSDDVFDGKRARGRTYLVPIGSASCQSNGSLLDAKVIELSAAAHDMAVTGTDDVFRIWHRPREASAEGVTPVVTARGGGSSTITDGSVRDKVAVLRSRRD